MKTGDVSSLNGFLSADYLLSPNILPEMTQEEKYELIEELCQRSEKAKQKLLSLRRMDIMNIISIETGKEMRSTNKAKPELVEQFFNIISANISRREKQSLNSVDPVAQSSAILALPLLNAPTSVRSKRKMSHPTRLPSAKYCNNSACRAPIKSNFCMRCSCYICHKFDENKNPSFWLVCESEARSHCGLSCHIECALNSDKAGIMGNGSGIKLDGSFQCGNCGHVIDLVSSWKKLMMQAKDARRVSDLCSRVYLSYRILESSERYRNLHEIVDHIRRKLEDEVGSINNLPLDMSRRLVQRLAVGAEVQRLCSRAVDLVCSEPLTAPQSFQAEAQNCEDGAANQTNLGCGLNALFRELKGDGPEPVSRSPVRCHPIGAEVQRPSSPARDLLGLEPLTIPRSDHAEAQGHEDGVANQTNMAYSLTPFPESKRAEPPIKNMLLDLNKFPEHHTEDNNATDGQPRTTDEDISTLSNSSYDPVSHIPLALGTQERGESFKEKDTTIKVGCKLELGAPSAVTNPDNHANAGYQQTIKVIRQLEQDGFIDGRFRKEFITWFSMRATPKNTMQVSVFIDTFSDDPQNLAEQLFHTFGEEIRRNKPPAGALPN